MAFYVYWNKLHVLVSFTLAITYAYIYMGAIELFPDIKKDQMSALLFTVLITVLSLSYPIVYKTKLKKYCGI